MASSAFNQNSVAEPTNAPALSTSSNDSSGTASLKLLDVLQMSSTSKQNGQLAHSKAVPIIQQTTPQISASTTALPQFPMLSSGSASFSAKQEPSSTVATIGHLVIPQKAASIEEKGSTSPSTLSPQDCDAPSSSRLLADTTSTNKTLSTTNFPYTIQQDVSGLSVQEIAKEAMRIAKESIRQQEQQAIQGDTAEDKMEIDASGKFNQSHLIVLRCT